METKFIFIAFLVAVFAFSSCSKNDEITPTQQNYKVYQRTNLGQDFKNEIKLNSDMTFELRNSRNEFARGSYSTAAKINPQDPDDYVLHYEQVKNGCENDWVEENINQLMEFTYYDEINSFTVEECK